MASGKSFKEIYGVSSTFTGGYMLPEDILIVGHDIPLEPWNEDLWDEARLEHAKAHPINPEDMIRLGGVKDPVSVTKRNGMVLAVEGRRRILGARAANDVLKEQGAHPEAWIKVPIYVDKSQNLELSVRLGNEGRLEDPPWIKAANAGRLRERGNDDATIRAAMGGVDAATLRQWYAYLDASPHIKLQAESKVIPFAVACELGKLGKGMNAEQELALECLYATGATLKGEDGKTNARNMVKAVKEGRVKSRADVAPPEPAAPHTPPAPPCPPLGAESPPFPVDTGRQTYQEPPRQDIPPAPAQQPGPGGGRGHSHGNGKPQVDLTVRRLSPKAISLVTAALEPDQSGDYFGYEDEQEMVAHAVMRVVSGQDPTGEGLSRWPHIAKTFSKFARSAPKGQEESK